MDDAAGEAFDKVAKLIGLPYPGGPLVDKYAQLGDPESFVFKGSKVDGLNMSFSGLKTQVLRFLQVRLKSDPTFIESNLHDFCASVQATIVGMLMLKLEQAVAETGITQVAIAGGVSANSGLRKALGHREDWQVFIPPLSYCTDNAAMVGIVGVLDAAEGMFGTLRDTPHPRMPQLTPCGSPR